MLENKPDSLEALIEALSPEIVQKLKTAVELGKWESGDRLSREQLENCLQAIIAWEHRNLPVEKRIGFIDPGAVAISACAAEPGSVQVRDKPRTMASDSGDDSRLPGMKGREK